MSDDLIRRIDAIKAMGDYLELLGVSRRYAKSVLNKIPSVEVWGKWERKESDNNERLNQTE